MKMGKRLLAMGIALFAAETALAATVSFSCITDNSNYSCDAGEAQLNVEVSDIGNNQVLFTVNNSGSIDSSITEVYFDDGTLLGLSSLIDKDDGVGGLDGVDFTAGDVRPPDLPGGQSIVPVFEATQGFVADADNPAPKRGVNTGEWLGIIFDLQSGGTFEDVMAELGDGRLRIGLHVTGYEVGDDDVSESFVNNPFVVPVPSMLPLFMGMVSLLLGWRVRKS